MGLKELFLTLIVFVGYFNPVTAQMQRATLAIAPTVERSGLTTIEQAIPLKEITPFLSFFVVWEGAPANFEVRFSSDRQRWTGWEVLQPDPHNLEANITELHLTHPQYRYVQLRYPGAAVQALTCHFFSPGRTPPVQSGIPPVLRSSDCALPPVIERESWCPTGQCPVVGQPQTTEVTHLIVHHSAGTNVANDWAAIVRAIWDLHVNGNGWDDIGYNYLIDPDGKIYTGRGDNILGAHFCAHNSQTMGICVMGNFQNQAPKTEAVNSLVELLTWKAAERDIDPAGKNFHPSSGLVLNNISGHREGCPTACPGDVFFPAFDSLRLRVADSVAACLLLTSTFGPTEPGLTIELFPNPAGDQLQLRLDKPVEDVIQIVLRNMEGQFIQQFQPSTPAKKIDYTIHLDKLPKGIYFLQFFHHKQIITRRFIKM